MRLRGNSVSKPKCKIHKWVERKGGWVEQCLAMECSECGIKGCACDARRQEEELKKLAELREKYGV
jgi:hypothetical protein